MSILRGTKCFIRTPRSPSYGLQHSQPPKESKRRKRNAKLRSRTSKKPWGPKLGHHGIRMDSGDRPEMRGNAQGESWLDWWPEKKPCFDPGCRTKSEFAILSRCEDGCCEIDTEWFSLRNTPEYLSWISWDVCWDMYVLNKTKIEPMQTVFFRSPARKRCLAGQYAFHAQLKTEPLTYRPTTPRFDQINGKPRFGRGNSSATIGSFMAKLRHLGSKWLPPMVGISNIALNNI